MSTDKMPKNAKKFYCENCDFTCSKHSNYVSHLLTRKHKLATKSTDKMPKNAEYTCECGKYYKDRSGLWRHKKKCTFKIDDTESNNEYENNQIVQNTSKNDNITLAKELVPLIKDLMVDVLPALQPNYIDNSTNNITNVNIFLNEQCKDAMNLTDFVESIQLTVEDVINVGEHGQTSGFANILIDKLSSLDLCKRPVHCSDAKRETLYVKNNDEWNKEAEDRPQIKDAIEYISRKGIQKVPELNLPDEKISDTIYELVKTPINHKKIISKMAKEVKI